MFRCNVVDQFLNDNRLSDTGPPKQPDLSPFKIRFNEIDHFDSGLEHFKIRVLFYEGGSGFVDRIFTRRMNRPQLVDGLANYINDAAQGGLADGNSDRASRVERRHTPYHAFRRL